MADIDFASRLVKLQAGLATITNIDNATSAVQFQQNEFKKALDANWVIVTMGLIFSIQIGTTLFEAGSARRGNAMGILFKNVGGTVITGLMWWLWGWALSFGFQNTGSVNGFVGNADLLLATDTSFPLTKYAFWAFQWALCNQATQLYFGATSERLTLFGTYVYSFLYSCFVYPIIAHWIWAESGWLSSFNTGATNRVGQNGLIDFSGATVVHLCGGIAAFAGAALIGPRSETPAKQPIQSTTLQYLGALFVWFGYYGFSTGGSRGLSNAMSEVVAKVSITVTLSAGAGAFIAYVLSRGDTSKTASGAIAGLVSIAGACSVVEPWAAFVIGLIGGASYYVAENVVRGAGIDDAASIFATHAVPGGWGTLAVGIFATKYNVQRTIGRDTNFYGFLYGGGANQFGTQVLGLIVVSVWAFVWGAVITVVLKAIGKLRVSEETETLGTDGTKDTEAYSNAYLGYTQPEEQKQDHQEGAALT